MVKVDMFLEEMIVLEVRQDYGSIDLCVFKPTFRFSELLLSSRFVLRSCAYMYGLSVFNYTDMYTLEEIWWLPNASKPIFAGMAFSELGFHTVRVRISLSNTVIKKNNPV